MNNCCRTCLREKRPSQLKLLSTKWNNTSLTFADLLMNIVQINKEIISDEIFLKICSSCELDLVVSYNFKTVCLNTEKILSERINQSLSTSTLPDQINEIKCETILNEDSSHEYENAFDDIDNFENNFNENNSIEIDECNENLKNISNKKHKTEISIERKTVDKCKVIPTKIKKEKLPKNSKLKNNDQINKKTTTSNNGKKTVRKRESTYCKKCDIRFAKVTLYIHHLEEKHYERYPCEICGKFFLQNRLQLHKVSHLTTKNFICDICDAKFVSLTKLKHHMRAHTGDKRYKCEFCDETFIYWTSRKNHIVVAHTKEKK